MKFAVFYKRTFLKELKKIPKNMRERIERFCFETIPDIKSLEEIRGLAKLTGYEDYYKVRFGDYRVGIEIDIEKKTIIFSRALHRKEIYKYYP